MNNQFLSESSIQRSDHHYVYHLQSTATTVDYAKIWLIHRLCCVLTLGFYLPWARIRERQYLYRHTVLNGHHFKYRDPAQLPLVKYSLAHFLLFLLIIGALFIADLTINLYLKQESDVSIFFFFPLFILLPYITNPLIISTLGVFLFAHTILYPYFLWQSKNLLVNHTIYRGIPFSFSGSLKESYSSYLSINALHILTVFLSFPWSYSVWQHYMINHISYADWQAYYHGNWKDIYRLFLIFFGVIAIPTALFIIPFFILVHFADNSSDNSSGNLIFLLLSLHIGISLPITIIMYHAIYSFFHIILTRYLLHHSLISNKTGDKITIHLSLDIWHLARISMINSIAKLCSFGLLTPWVSIRMQQYLFSCLAIHSSVPLHEIDPTTPHTESC